MSAHQDQAQILAFAVFELRLLLAEHLGGNNNSDPSTRAAAHLAYSFHNEALAVLEGRDFDANTEAPRVSWRPVGLSQASVKAV
ncbi:hypothetical protein [Ideonella margarita]|uniref:Uncharacterized protein n=1 Tax=Ideonella margarita TaxID=2984191 RepID=A0ABU9C6N9_9BURK